MSLDLDNPHKWFTAGEAAELARERGVGYVPLTRWGMSKRMERESQQNPGEARAFARRRAGQNGGGGTEYYWCFFPKLLWDVLDGEVERRENALPIKPPALTRRSARRSQWTKDWPTKPTINLDPPYWGRAETFARLAGLDYMPTFEPYVIRVASRCLIKLGRKLYFSRDLNDWHGKKVCVTWSNEVPHLVWVCKFDTPRRQRRWVHGAGGFICVADDRAGKAPYVPLEFQRAAEATRAAGAARRAALREQDQRILLRDLGKEQLPDPDS